MLQNLESLHDLLSPPKMFHLPSVEGRFGKVNPAGIAFYNRLIDSLLLKGIAPTYVIQRPCTF